MSITSMLCFTLLLFGLHCTNSDNTCTERQLPETIVIGYANWGQCDHKIIESAQNGVNIIIWFSIDLSMNTTTNKPYINSKVDINCVAQIAYSIEQLSLPYNIIHLISIGGWNAAHPNTNIPVDQMYNEFHHWNTKQVANDKYNFHGFDGIDWDIEGNDDLNHPQNIMTANVIHFMGQFSQLAKQNNYLVTMAPAESYLDPTTSGFDRSLKHNYKEWIQLQPGFTYHGLNTYAPLLSDMYSKTYISDLDVNVDTFDLITIQLYEGYSHAEYNISILQQSISEYLDNFIALITNKWWVNFSDDDELSIESQFIMVPKNKLIIGLANGWAGDGKFLLLRPDELKHAYDYLKKRDNIPKGFAFWNIKDEGLKNIFLATTLRSLLTDS